MKTRLRCVLLDDELPGLAYLKMLCDQIPQLEVVKAFNNPGVFMDEMTNIDFDLCILDIEMPEMNGLQIANLLKGKPVIFTTAYKDYAADAFDLQALDYIRKPIILERLRQAVEKAVKQYGNSTGDERRTFIQLNTNKGKAILFFDKIAFIKSCETDSRDKILMLFDGEEFVLKNITFEKMASILPSADFCRVNKKEMIALKAVKLFSYDEIITTLMTNQHKNIRIVLSEIYRHVFLQKVKS